MQQVDEISVARGRGQLFICIQSNTRWDHLFLFKYTSSLEDQRGWTIRAQALYLVW